MVNRLTLKINIPVEDSIWRPGLPLINDPKYGLQDLTQFEKNKVLIKFCEYLAEKMKNNLKMRIMIQYRYIKWAPLTPGYEEFKKKAGLSLNIWEATGLLLDSITYYKKDDYIAIGIDPHVTYPNSNTSVLFVAKCMEFGTRYMPARPLFGPTLRFMRRHVRNYWEYFLKDYQMR